MKKWITLVSAAQQLDTDITNIEKIVKEEGFETKDEFGITYVKADSLSVYKQKQNPSPTANKGGTIKKQTKEMLRETFWTNKKGERVHRDLIKWDEQVKTELVYGLTDTALRGVEILHRFKGTVVSRVEEYINEMREKYNLDVSRGTKGNITLVSYDGLRKVQIAVQTRIDFDEKLALAKEKLDEYFTLKTKNSDPEIRTLITRVFEVDKKGNVNAKQILSLKSYKISHPLWQEAMGIIDEAVEIVGSKSYVRFYMRHSIEEPWSNIALDFAAV